MDKNLKNILLIIGVIAGAYIAVFYVLPPFLRLLGLVLAAAFKILIFAAAVVGLYVIAKFTIEYFQEK